MKFLRQRKRERELESELEAHIAHEAEENAARGMTPGQAMREARIRLGSAVQIRETVHEQIRMKWLETLIRDLRYGARQLRRSPGFTLTAVLSLALGIGAVTTLFGVVNAVLLRPLPYPSADRLVAVLEAKPQQGIAGNGSSYVDLEEWARTSQTMLALGGVTMHHLTLTGRGEPGLVATVVVTPGVFPVLGTAPLIGRTINAPDCSLGSAPVVVISEALWRGRFGADKAILGKQVMLDSLNFTVVGVMPTGFQVPIFRSVQDVWIPVSQDPYFKQWIPRLGGHWLRVMGRMKPGVSMAEAQQEMNTLAERSNTHEPAGDSGWQVVLEALQPALTQDVRPALMISFAAVGLVLLIACANVANLLMTRAVARSREMALRLALGAGRGRIRTQLLAENALLGAASAAAGILCAVAGVRFISGILPEDMPLFTPIQLDGWVLGFALLTSLVATLIFGLAPAVTAVDDRIQTTLKAGAVAAGESRTHRRLRRTFAAVEVALALVLVTSACLFTRSLIALNSVNPGFQPQGLFKAEVSLPQYQYKTPAQWTLFGNDLLNRMQSTPELKNAAIGLPLPLVDGGVNLGFSIPGRPVGNTGSTADYASVSPEYFRVMQIPLLRGRVFTPEDSPAHPPVTVISDTLARTYFRGQDPVGQHLFFGFPSLGGALREIVGVVGDIRDTGLNNKPGPMMYVPYAQAPLWGAEVVARGGASGIAQQGAMQGALRRVVAQMDPNLPVTDAAMMDDAIGETVAQPRFRTWLLGLFGAAALLLAAIGVFGVVSYITNGRTHEFGVRMALGATPRAIRRAVLRDGLTLALLGLAVGLPVQLLVGRALASELYGIGVSDPVAVTAAAILMLAMVLAASFIPAGRATRVDPLRALRQE